MANVNAYTGFMPTRHLNNAHPITQKFNIASGYAVNIFTGDAVILSSGKVNIAAANSGIILGIFAGCQFLDASGVPGARFSPYWPASTVTTGAADATAFLWVDPSIIYRVQTSVDLAYVDATHLGAYADCVLTHAGSTLTGQSGMELNLNDAGDTQFQVLGLIDEPGNVAGTNAKVEVRIRKSLFNTN